MLCFKKKIFEGAPNHFNIAAMIYTAQRIQGFVASPYLRKPDFLSDMAKWMNEKKV